MAFSGDTFSKLFNWFTDPVRNEKIFNSRLDAEFGGIATGLSTVAGRATALEAINTAWATYTPTLGAGSGTFTSAVASGRFKAIGKTVFFEAKVVITTNGTAATFISMTIPATPQANNIYVVAGIRDDAASVTGNIGATTVNIFKYDGTYPGADGRALWVSGVYESS